MNARTSIVLGLLGLASASARPAGHFDTWRLEGGRVVADAGGADFALPVGSLQKPFVAKAWAAEHADRPTPRLRCDGRRCWLRAGHGTLGLSRAVAVSCNEYFLGLAAETPGARLRSTLAAEGFAVRGEVTPEAAVGLGDAVAAAPSRLLAAYVELTRTPWLSGESVRREVLNGLRRAALDGTAQGLGRRGYWAKTGTVEARGRARLQTVGFALAVDDAGGAILARLDPGTGREAARALGAWLARAAIHSRREPPAEPPDAHARGSVSGAGTVRVQLFAALRPRRVMAVNRGSAPVGGVHGFVGPGGSVSLRPGDRLEDSLWELRLPEQRLVRRLHGALACEQDGGGALEIVAEMEAREYVSGVIAAELPEGEAVRRLALGAAVMRFRARGARHPRVDFCDTTHCAWFVGRGPRVRWPAPQQAILDASPSRLLEEAEWVRVLEDAQAAGPTHWTSHCGGRPLSTHAVWGGGDRSVVACPLHDGASSRPWSRTWSDEALARAFGGPVSRLEVTAPEGVYHVEVTTPAARQGLLYDTAHRRLAGVLGWGAMPSPPDRIVRTAAGFRAEGVGLGHRVGLCLGDTP